MGKPIDPPEGDVIARNLAEQTDGRWVCWYGHATGTYWATPRRPHPWSGLREGATPAALLAAIGEVDAYFGGPMRRREGAWRTAA